MQGWISLHRKILEHWIWENEKYFKAWVWMLLRANHESNKILFGADLINIKRGEFITSLNNIQMNTGLTMRATRTFLTLLEKDKMIVKKSTSKTTKITILNYDSYQPGRQTNDKRVTSKRQTNDKQATTDNNVYNNDNNVNNDKNSLVFDFENLKKELLNSENWITETARYFKSEVPVVKENLISFLYELKIKDDYFKAIGDVKSHFINWFKKNYQKETPPKIYQHPDFWDKTYFESIQRDAAAQTSYFEHLKKLGYKRVKRGLYDFDYEKT